MELPAELWVHIFSFLDRPVDLARCGSVCMLWHNLTDDFLWRRMSYSLWPGQQEVLDTKTKLKQFHWKQFAITNVRWLHGRLARFCELPAHDEVVYTVAIHDLGDNRGLLVASASRDCTAKLWNITSTSRREPYSPKMLATIDNDYKFVYNVAFVNLEGEVHLLITGMAGTAFLAKLDMSTSTLHITPLKGHNNDVNSLDIYHPVNSFQPRVLTGASELILWDLATCKPLAIYKDKECIQTYFSAIHQAQYNNHLVATATYEAAQLWDLSRGLPLVTYTSSGFTIDVAFAEHTNLLWYGHGRTASAVDPRVVSTSSNGSNAAMHCVIRNDGFLRAVLGITVGNAGFTENQYVYLSSVNAVYCYDTRRAAQPVVEMSSPQVFPDSNEWAILVPSDVSQVRYDGIKAIVCDRFDMSVWEPRGGRMVQHCPTDRLLTGLAVSEEYAVVSTSAPLGGGCNTRVEVFRV